MVSNKLLIGVICCLLLAVFCTAEPGPEKKGINGHKFAFPRYMFRSVLGSTRDSANRPSFPLYKQTDPKWASEPLGRGPHTIGQWGCLLCSVAMAINGYGLRVDGKDATPLTVNQWLRDNGGFEDFDGQSFRFPSIWPFGFTYLGTIPGSNLLRQNLDIPNRVVILHVRNFHHFILAVGYDDKGVKVHDTEHPVDHYKWTEIDEYVVYHLDLSVSRNVATVD